MFSRPFNLRATLTGGPVSILQGSVGTASQCDAYSWVSASYTAQEAWNGIKDGAGGFGDCWRSNRVPTGSDTMDWIDWTFPSAKNLSGFRFETRSSVIDTAWPDDVRWYGKTSAQDWADATLLYDGAISGASGLSSGDWCAWHSFTTTGDFDEYRMVIDSTHAIGSSSGQPEVQEFEFSETAVSATSGVAYSDIFEVDGELDADAFPAARLVSTLSVGSISATNIDRSRHYYRATITGWQDGLSDLVVPISSLQARSRSGNPTYVNVVVPGVDAYAEDIADRENGELVVDLVYRNSAGEDVQKEEIARVDIEDIQTHEGGRSASIVIEGRRTLSYTAKTVALTGSVYRRLSYGRLSYRFVEPDPYLRPGDTVTTDQGDSFTVDSITYILTPAQQSMELHEEAA